MNQWCRLRFHRNSKLFLLYRDEISLNFRDMMNNDKLWRSTIARREKREKILTFHGFFFSECCYMVLVSSIIIARLQMKLGTVILRTSCRFHCSKPERYKRQEMFSYLDGVPPLEDPSSLKVLFVLNADLWVSSFPFIFLTLDAPTIVFFPLVLMRLISSIRSVRKDAKLCLNFYTILSRIVA